MENKLLEKLKNNERGWFFLLEEEKNVIEKANKKAMVENLLFSGKWDKNEKGWDLSNVGAYEIFRISSAYQPEPEPEHIDLPIVESPHPDSPYGKIGIWIDNEFAFIKHKFVEIHETPSMSNFVDFRLGKTNDSPTIIIESVARTIRQGKTVYARFRK